MKENKEEKKPDMIKLANEAAERLEAANQKQEELLARAETLRVEETLSGKAEAGKETKEKTSDDYARELAREITGEKDF